LGGVRITQRQLAEAFSAHRRITTSSISSWESRVVPPEEWIDVYSIFFATPRSLDLEAHLLAAGDLTPEERETMVALRAELNGLRVAALAPEAEGDGPRLFAQGPWVLTNDESEQVTIVCAPLPPEIRARMPYTDSEDPDYIELYTYADLDALLELHGHIRAVNPRAEVRVRTAATLQADDASSHLVLLGGVDWNHLTRRVLNSLGLGVSQRWVGSEKDVGQFEVSDNDEVATFESVVDRSGGRVRLIEDVAHFYRGPNPFNKERTVTICNGMYGRGVLGAVRTLTDKQFRERNAAYIERTFGTASSYSILARVRIVAREVVTPDWTDPATRLHGWSAPYA
jgi:hypothetical protein